mmetsp:Transcript_5614/g.16578  ORF Transcript_5614/g.16578 Transcript_5614/m.16578 type:complete len:143 (+) Transcript_5614:199-627(+)
MGVGPSGLAPAPSTPVAFSDAALPLVGLSREKLLKLRTAFRHYARSYVVDAEEFGEIASSALTPAEVEALFGLLKEDAMVDVTRMLAPAALTAACANPADAAGLLAGAGADATITPRRLAASARVAGARPAASARVAGEARS